jgi:hypothetical protein
LILADKPCVISNPPSPTVFQTLNDVKSALQTRQIAAFVTDTPTAQCQVAAARSLGLSQATALRHVILTAPKDERTQKFLRRIVEAGRL